MNFKRFFQEGIMTDVTLKVENEEIKCHKIILSCQSTYFESLFKTLPLESEFILTSNFNYKITKFIIEYLYDNTIDFEPKTTANEYIEIFCSSQYFGVDKLTDRCTEMLFKKYEKCKESDTIIQLLKLEQINKIPNLEKLYHSFKIDEKKLKLDEIDNGCLYQLFNYEILPICEDNIFGKLTKWIDIHKIKKDDIDNIIIKFITLAPPHSIDFIMEVIDNYCIKKNEIKCILYNHYRLLKPISAVINPGKKYNDLPISILFTRKLPLKMKNVVIYSSNKYLEITANIVSSQGIKYLGLDINSKPNVQLISCFILHYNNENRIIERLYNEDKDTQLSKYFNLGEYNELVKYVTGEHLINVVCRFKLKEE
jgi:hypothetical protein